MSFRRTRTVQSPYWVGLEGRQLAGGIANQAIAVAVYLYQAAIIKQLQLSIASTTGNFDMGIYAWTGFGATASRLYSTGPLPHTGVNGDVLIHDIPFRQWVRLPAGMVWFVAASDAANRVGAAQVINSSRVRVVNASYPLPATLGVGVASGVGPSMVGVLA